MFVVQKHRASTLHYDFRLEVGGVLKSWVLPKGPSLDPSVRRLAIPVEDHPLDYSGFEGVIPPGNYGAGAVIVWDRGGYVNLKPERGVEEWLEEGHLSLGLEGVKLRGGFHLLRTRRGDWLFFKARDGYERPGWDVLEEMPNSVLTGRSLEELAGEP